MVAASLLGDGLGRLVGFSLAKAARVNHGVRRDRQRHLNLCVDASELTGEGI